MRPVAVLLLAVAVLAGCVPTADFTALRDELRQVQAENKKMRETDADLRRRLEEQDRLLKPADVARRFESLEQRLEALSARLEEAEARPKVKAPSREPKPEFPAAKQGKGEGLDSVAVLTPTAAYNQAYNDYLKGNYDLAIAGFESFLKQFPSTSLSAHAQFWIGEAYYNKRDYKAALEAYDQLFNEKKYEKNDRLAAALYKSGLASAALGDTARARSFFKRVADEHPMSNEAPLAKQRLTDLR